MIKISVIVPVYNTSKYLKKCLDSILFQSLKEIEIIVVNDGSTDDSLRILKEYQNKDSRIKIINQKNMGLSGARNSGIKLAQGEYILHIDSDDWIEQDYLKDMYELAEKEEADIVISDFYIDYNGEKVNYLIDQGKNRIINKEQCLKYIFYLKGYPAVWNKLFKRKLYTDNRIEHPININLGEDLGTTPKLIYFSNKIVKLNKAYIHYMQNATSITKTKRLESILQLYSCGKELEKFFCNKNISIIGLKATYWSTLLFSDKNIFIEEKYKTLLKEYLIDIKKINICKVKSKKLRLYFLILKVINTIFCLKVIFKLEKSVQKYQKRRIK